MKRIMTILLMMLCIMSFSQIDMQAKSKKTSRKGRTEVVKAVMAGYVGNQEINELVIGYFKENYYHIDGVKRTVKVTRKGNNMVLKAYFRGEYIGTFDGKITYYRWKNEINIDTYIGTFTSINGDKISFELHVSAA